MTRSCYTDIHVEVNSFYHLKNATKTGVFSALFDAMNSLE